MSTSHSLAIDLEPSPLRDAFLRWQCRVRQIAMREKGGRPDAAITPAVTLEGEHEPLGHIITVLSKSPAYSTTSEFMHMARKTNDPAQRSEQAVQFLSSSYYQKPHEFSEMLTATFTPNSPGAMRIRAAEYCTLSFESYSQRFDLRCRVWRLRPEDALYQATWWHNHLFNPNLEGDTIVLGFEPVWSESDADPQP